MFLEMPNGEVSKSFTPKTGWKPVTQMTRMERGQIKNRNTQSRAAREFFDKYGARITNYSKHTRSGKKVVTGVAVGGPPGKQMPHYGKQEAIKRIKRKGLNVPASEATFNVVRTSGITPERIIRYTESAPSGIYRKEVAARRRGGRTGTRGGERMRGQ